MARGILLARRQLWRPRVAALSLLNGENGSAFDASDNSMVVTNSVTPAQSYVGTPGNKFTVANAANRWRFNSSGLYVTVGNTELRRDHNPKRNGKPGILFEPQRIFRGLRCRDLTNPVWVTTNCTPLKDQVGIDGVANACSSLEFTGANGTCLQTVTDASKARVVHAYVSRLAGSDPVDMTMDGGTTWTPVTLTGTKSLVSIPTQTLANPVYGFRGQTGNKIAVDFASLEDGTYPTSPVVVDGANVTRGADVPTHALSGLPFSATGGTLYYEFSLIAPTSPTLKGVTAFDGAGAWQESITINAQASTGRQVINCVNDASTVVNTQYTPFLPAAFTSYKAIASWAADDFAILANGGNTPGVDTNTAGLLPTIDTLRLGHGNAALSVEQLGGWLDKWALFPRTFSDAEMVARVA